MTKSHISAVNTPQGVEVPKGSSITINAPQRQKHGRPIRARKKSNKETMSLLKPLEEDHPKNDNPSTFVRAPNNHNTGIAE